MVLQGEEIEDGNEERKEKERKRIEDRLKNLKERER